MSAHATPFHCPYCGEEQLLPASDRAGEWHCADCDRFFALRFLGVGAGVGASAGVSGRADGTAAHAAGPRETVRRVAS